MPPARIVLWVASIGGVALALRSVVLGPVPVSVAALALVFYVALATAGVLVPQWEMFADVFHRGDHTAPYVALTFDDGPNPDTTPKILAVLAEADVPATFFMVGEKVEKHPELVREVVSRGHTIGVHGHAHHRLYAFLSPAAVVRDLSLAVAAVERAAGIRPAWFRPPIGQVSPRTGAGARRAGLTLVAWSARGLDGLRGADPAAVARRISRRLGPGAVILLHDAAERDDFVPASLAALPLVLERIREKGLTVTPLGALMEAAPR